MLTATHLKGLGAHRDGCSDARSHFQYVHTHRALAMLSFSPARVLADPECSAPNFLMRTSHICHDASQKQRRKALIVRKPVAFRQYGDGMIARI